MNHTGGAFGGLAGAEASEEINPLNGRITQPPHTQKS
jgi:hypothetical protein